MPTPDAFATMLCQVQAPKAPVLPVNFVEKLYHFQMPTQGDYLNCLTGQVGSLQAMLLLACGLFYLLAGWKFFKMLVILNAGTLGALAGLRIGAMLQGPNMPIFCAIAGGLLCAVLAWPLMKWAVSVMGGLAGAFLGYGVWNYVSKAAGVGLDQYSWVGALVGLVMLGLLAFIIFRETIIIFTSFQGAILTVSGLVALVMHFESVSANLHDALTKNVHLMPVVILVLGVIGYAFQHTGKKAGHPASHTAGQPAKKAA